MKPEITVFAGSFSTQPLNNIISIAHGLKVGTSQYTALTSISTNAATFGEIG
jgi:hypothetical protein